MQASKIIGLLAFTSLLFTACEKEEKPFVLPPAGDTKYQTVSMGENYDSSIYVNFATGKTYTYAVSAWDISFENGAEGYGIFLNGGIEAQISKTTSTNWEDNINVSSLEWRYDNPNGNPDSTSIGRWTDSPSYIYVIDLGKAAASRYKKIKFVSVDADKYVIQFAEMQGNSPQKIEIAKTGSSSLLYYSFTTKNTVNWEPASDDWDIVFTRYRHVYYDMTPVTTYYVTGALINPYKVSAAKLKQPAFADISKVEAAAAAYSSAKNFIGFDWKYYDLSANKYLTNSNVSYLIQDQTGNIYKLRFTDFYSKSGVKGSPNFEYQRL